MGHALAAETRASPRRTPLTGAVVAAVLVGLLLGRFAMAGRDTSPPPAVAPRAATTTDDRIARLQARLRADARQPRLLTELGAASLARARETADPTWYTKAGGALERARALAPDDPSTMVALGVLGLTRHDFAGAAALGRRAIALDRGSADAQGVVTDALVELGRYDEAAASAQRMVDERPALPSYSRVSYLRELHGDVVGARAAMSQAVAAGGSPDDVAYVRTLLGDLHLASGDLASADAAYRAVLRSVPGYGAAELGRARVAAAGGALGAAVRRVEPLARRLPFPATVSFLGDLYAATGRPADAARQYELVRAEEQLNAANGVAVDLESARFEADHARDPGADPTAPVAQAERALASRPTVFAEDTLGWALRQAGRPADALPHNEAAVRLGTADALLWYHLATVEADLGLTTEAAAHLSRAFAVNVHLTVRDLPVATDLARRLGVEVPG